MKSRNSGYSSDSEQNGQDLSVLRKPIIGGVTGFLESKRAYDNGTEEVRRLLSRECDVLYECKVCRSMFRSLTNFISHKRVYCRTAFNNISNHPNCSNGFMDQDISTIIQEEKDFKNHSSTTKDSRTNENSNKDLSSIIERLLKREQTNSTMKLTDFYDQVSNKLTQDEMLRKRHELQLDRVPNSSVAVYQTVKRDEKDNIKTEVMEVNDLILNQKNILGTDGKILVNDRLESHESFGSFNKMAATETIACDICKLKFSTEKTLKLHIQSKHISSTFVYQCPSCSQTFLQPRAVFRHLSNDHKKSIRRIRLMRDSILRRRVRIDEIQTKGPSRELARLQTDSEKREAENKSWTKNAELSNNSPMCSYCGKKFERKAVLTTHLNNCPMKNKNASGPQTRRFNEIASNRNENGNTATNTAAVVSNGHNLDELKDIKDMDLSQLEEYLNLNNETSRCNSPVNKRKRRRATKIGGQQFDVTDTEPLNDLFWKIDTSENMSLKTVSLDSSTSPPLPLPLPPPPPSINTEPPEKPVTEKNCKHYKKNEINKEVTFYCRICEKKFDILSNLRRHISMFHYRKRKFGCKLCDYRAFRKYDVINHLNSNHSISGEREEVLQYVVVKELKCERNEENIDADVIVDDSGTFETDVLPKIIEKQRRRTRVKDTSKSPVENLSRESTPSAEIKPIESSKFARTSSNLSLSSNDEQPTANLSKRPIRNRVKPVNKDFVYDLSNLLKKDMVLSEKPQRRRTTQPPIIDDSSRDSLSPPSLSNGESPASESAGQSPSRIIELNPNVKGASQRMALLAVTSFNACFYKPPELPAERPSPIPRLLSPPISETIGAWSIAKLSDARRLSDDNILHVLAKHRRLDIAQKQTLPQQQQQQQPLNCTKSLAGDIISPKIELNINGDSKVKLSQAASSSSRSQDVISDDNKIIVKLFSTEKEFKERLIANRLAEPGATTVPVFSDTKTSNAQSSSKASTSPKRITLMERLAENKKLRENFLKLS